MTNLFIYSRTVSFYRQGTQLAAGNVGYMGRSRPAETLILANVKASVQCPNTGTNRTGDGKLADDAPGPVRWLIFTPKGAVPKGAIKANDIVIDDELNRYQITAAYWTPISYKIHTIRLEA